MVNLNIDNKIEKQKKIMPYEIFRKINNSLLNIYSVKTEMYTKIAEIIED